jgi:hypothetical protein
MFDQLATIITIYFTLMFLAGAGVVGLIWWLL